MPISMPNIRVISFDEDKSRSIDPSSSFLFCRQSEQIVSISSIAFSHLYDIGDQQSVSLRLLQRDIQERIGEDLRVFLSTKTSEKQKEERARTDRIVIDGISVEENNEIVFRFDCLCHVDKKICLGNNSIRTNERTNEENNSSASCQWILCKN